MRQVLQIGQCTYEMYEIYGKGEGSAVVYRQLALQVAVQLVQVALLLAVQLVVPLAVQLAVHACLA